MDSVNVDCVKGNGIMRKLLLLLILLTPAAFGQEHYLPPWLVASPLSFFQQLLPLLGAGAGGGSGAINFMLSALTNSSTQTAQTATTNSINATGATAVFLVVQNAITTCPVSGGNPFSISTSPSNTISGPDVSQLTETAGLYIYHVFSPSVSGTMTASITSANSNCLPSISIITATGTFSGVVDKTNGASSTSSAAQQTGSTGTLSTSVEFCIAALTTGGSSAQTPTINSSFTTTGWNPPVAGKARASGGAYLVTAATTALNPTWSLTTAESTNAGIACYY